MSSKSEKEGGVEWELAQAEYAMIAAGDDPAALAIAFRRHSEAIRNMMQGAIVPSFIDLVERVLDKKLNSVVDGINGLRTDVQSAVLNVVAQLGTLTDDMSRVDTQLTRLEAQHGAIITTVTDMQETLDGRTEWFARIEGKLDRLAHETLANELDRRTRLRNVAFIELLMAQYPELTAEAERRAKEDHGDA